MQDAGYIKIPLLRRDGLVVGHALVDACDSHLADDRWHLDSHGYARRKFRRKAILMHRVILDLHEGDGQQVDHINRDPLDNRRANLRIVTHAENMQNTPSRRGSSSPFRAVTWESHKAAWSARGTLAGKRIRLGYFDSEILAACAAEAWRREHMPFSQPDPELMKIIEAVQSLAA